MSGASYRFVQCGGVTKKGLRCQRTVPLGIWPGQNGYCNWHQDQIPPDPIVVNTMSEKERFVRGHLLNPILLIVAFFSVSIAVMSLLFLFLWWLVWMIYLQKDLNAKKVIWPDDDDWEKYHDVGEKKPEMKFQSWPEYTGKESNQVSYAYACSLFFVVWWLWFILYNLLLFNSNYDPITESMVYLNSIPATISTYWIAPLVLVNEIEDLWS